MSKIEQTKIPADIVYRTSNWKLVRERDGLTQYAHKAIWIEWDEFGNSNEGHDDPAIGRSLILDSHRLSYTWLTTSVVEIIEQNENYTKFNTKNSVYELWKLNVNK